MSPINNIDPATGQRIYQRPQNPYIWLFILLPVAAMVLLGVALYKSICQVGAQFYSDQGNQDYHDQHYADAASDYIEASRLDSTVDKYPEFAGRVLMEEKKYPDAIAYLKSAVQLYPSKAAYKQELQTALKSAGKNIAPAKSVPGT